MERLDALAVREGKDGGKSFFTKIGAAFPNKDGKGYTVLLDAVPASTDGQVKIMLREPLPKDGQRGGGGGSHEAADLDDSVPFIVCDPALEHRVR
jgi:hypothetical protein